jgi:hypothetical protein
LFTIEENNELEDINIVKIKNRILIEIKVILDFELKMKAKKTKNNENKAIPEPVVNKVKVITKSLK